jgi:leucyl-tRNA synthetase
MHDWLISRQRYWGPPIPIVHCPACGPVLVSDNELPVLLPEQDEPLANNDEWAATTCPRCEGPARRETDVSDTFFDSSWYFLRYPSVDVNDRPWAGDRTARFLPAAFYAGGPEHVRRHHLYARFVTMALFDMGLVPFEEPFPCIRLGGLIRHDGAKMSKSRGNVVDPDDYVDRYGADVLRLFLLFSGPWEEGGDFTDQAIVGVERFLARVWRAVERQSAGDPEVTARTITAVTAAIHRFRFNVAIAALMSEVDSIEPRTLVLLLAPLAPYVAEEMWQRMGGDYSVHQQRWPVADRDSSAANGSVEIVVQVDGKRRGQVAVPSDAGSAAIVESASVAVAGWLAERAVERVVNVPGRLVNFVTVAK